MKDLISVVVPVYNGEQDIVRCLDSIRAQTYVNMEIIAVNDGSTDNTGTILNLYSASHHGIRVIHKENGGVTSARIRGALEATGEWIGFIDSDDEIESDMYHRLLENAKKYDAQISHCGYQLRFIDGRVDYFYNTGTLEAQDRNTSLKELLSGKRVEPGLWNKLFHKSLFPILFRQGVVDTDIKINEDLLMNFYLFREARLTVFEDFCPYHYIVRDDSASRKGLNVHDLWDPVKVKQIILDQIPEELEQDACRAYLKTCISSCGRIARENNDKYEADFLAFRKLLQDNKYRLSLLDKKYQIYAWFILYTPRIFGPLYRFYFHNLSARPYD